MVDTTLQTFDIRCVDEELGTMRFEEGYRV